MSNELFISYYDDVLALLDELHEHRTYASGSYYHALEHGEKFLNKRFRAVYSVANPLIYADNIKNLEDRYKVILREINKDNKKFNSEKIRRPLYLPRVEQDYVKIQIHENLAHSSQKLTKNEWLNLSDIFNVNNSIELEICNIESEEKLKKMGLKTTLVDNVLTVSVESICDYFNCESIQLRTQTGRQIRANFFSRDSRGQLKKSQLRSLGTLIVSNNIAVERSLDRSTRADAIYIDDHPDEIQLPLSVQTKSRIYANR